MKKRIGAEALKKIKEELNHLKTVKRREMAAQLKEAISFGDLSENAAYHEAKDAQSFLEGRIMELENIVRSSIVCHVEKFGKVGPGSLVTVYTNEEKEKFEIVNIVESDPLNGKISENSPIGKALLGRSEGDICEVETPAGEIIRYKILEIK